MKVQQHACCSAQIRDCFLVQLPNEARNNFHLFRQNLHLLSVMIGLGLERGVKGVRLSTPPWGAEQLRLSRFTRKSARDGSQRFFLPDLVRVERDRRLCQQLHARDSPRFEPPSEIGDRCHWMDVSMIKPPAPIKPRSGCYGNAGPEWRGFALMCRYLSLTILASNCLGNQVGFRVFLTQRQDTAGRTSNRPRRQPPERPESQAKHGNR